MNYRIIETDNFGSDYPNEKFVTPLPVITSKEKAEAVANAINVCTGPNHPRFYLVVEEGYKLQPGFEP